MKLIDKTAIVAWAKETYIYENASEIRKICFKQLLKYLDSIEIKKEFWDSEKVIEWLMNNINNYLVKGRDIDLIYEDLKKAMED